MIDEDEMADIYLSALWNPDIDPEEDVTCRFCKKPHLWWYLRGDAYVLFEWRPGGHTAPHRCNRGLTKADIVSQFDDIS